MNERTVLVTGCSSGFGLGIAQAFAARGWTVFAGLRDPEKQPAALACLNIIPLDLADDAQITAAASRIDRLDCLINNAGYALNGPFSSYSAIQMQRQMQVNVLGPALLTQRLLPALIAANGRIIHISSLAGEIGMPMNSLYCASKFAVEGLSESLRHELAPLGIQVALVEPGGFRTRFAANMEWGEFPPAPQTLESSHLESYRAAQARMLVRKGKDPEGVVKAVLQLAEARVMPLRTRVGSDAKAVRLIKRWLPERAASALLGAVFQRLLSPEKSK